MKEKYICERCKKIFVSNKKKKFCSHKCSKFTNDDLSPFRWFLHRIKKNCKAKENRKNRKIKVDTKLTAQDLKNIWDKQEGKCILTGWELKTYKNTDWHNKVPLTPDKASIDRIDPEKDYTKDNLQFLSYMGQMAKYIFSNKEVLNFCESAINYNSKNKKTPAF